MTKKVGVISLYYHNYNYGGCLQAYAMVLAIQKLGYQVEQLSYDREFEKSAPALSVKNQMVVALKRKLPGTFLNRTYKNHVLFDHFIHMIPHSEVVYTARSIAQAEGKYDAFVAGSDQIWNPRYACDAYYLGFVGGGKRKISYAASIGNNRLEQSTINLMREKLQDFDAISVREASASELLNGRVGVKAIRVLDPVLLLHPAELDELAASARQVRHTKPYAVTYLLGNLEKNYQVCEEYSQRLGIKLVSIPTKPEDVVLGKPQYGVGPKEFISLIRDAELVITDSFHATVLSILYHKKSIILQRNMSNDAESMNSRIEDLFELFANQFHWGDVANAAENTPDWELVDQILNEERERSIAFLENSLIEEPHVEIKGDKKHG